jgi:sulfate adenylyltransferase
MKSAWFASNADAVLVSAVIGEKKVGDSIDEAVILGQDMLREAGYFLPDVHKTSILLWDMRYAGPREAVFHALVRKNLGCTHPCSAGTTPASGSTTTPTPPTGSSRRSPTSASSRC